MLRDADLLAHLPPYLQQFRELYQIMKTEDPEFQLAFDESERIKNNQYITTSDIRGIERFESMLNIYPSSMDTLESRISRVLSRWNDSTAYTANSLEDKLVSLSDGAEFNIIKKYDEYTIEIETNLGLFGQVAELERIINYMFPSHMIVISRNSLYGHARASYNLGGGAVVTRFFTLTHDYSDSISSKGNYYVGSASTHASKQVGVLDYESELESNAQLKHGSISVNTSKHKLTQDYEKVLDAAGKINKGSNTSVVSIIEID